jgi:hypothetical protein
VLCTALIGHVDRSERTARGPADATSHNRLPAGPDIHLLILHEHPLGALRLELLEHQTGVLVDVHHPGGGVRERGDLARLELPRALFE